MICTGYPYWQLYHRNPRHLPWPFLIGYQSIPSDHRCVSKSCCGPWSHHVLQTNNTNFSCHQNPLFWVSITLLVRIALCWLYSTTILEGGLKKWENFSSFSKEKRLPLLTTQERRFSISSSDKPVISEIRSGVIPRETILRINCRRSSLRPLFQALFQALF